LPAWRSNGGGGRGHPAKAWPFSFEVPIPNEIGELTQIVLIGVFAQFADRQNEAPGTVGATLQLAGHGEIVFRLDLANGRHYRDAHLVQPLDESLGDGSRIMTVGRVEIDGREHRVDRLVVEVPAGIGATNLSFRDLGSPASFSIFSCFVAHRVPFGCPFRHGQGRVGLSDLPEIVRIGDRLRLRQALAQLEEALEGTIDLDEARGQALTFLAVLTAAMLERGGSRELHLEQLEAARELDRLAEIAAIAGAARRRAEAIVYELLESPVSPSDRLVNRSLALVDRFYGKALTDASVADQLGLSTSHFRYLFRQATGQPFHKYLVALRLEKARRMLIESELPISEIAKAVGFTGISHFSRAFSQRFRVSPTSLRRVSG
jgi:AraC-like DNA-binding protein